MIYTLITSVIGVNPIITISTIYSSFVSFTIVKDFIYLSLLGYALLIAFKGSLWNIGAEGQIYIATIPVVLLTLELFYTIDNVPLYQSIIIVFASIVLATLFGALWGGLAGVIRAYLGVDEVPVTLILNYVAYYAINILVLGPFQGRYVYGYKRTDMVPDAYRLTVGVPIRFTNNPLVDEALKFVREVIMYSWWIIGLALVALFTWYLLNKTSIGLKIKVIGSNPDYLSYAGYDVRKQIVITFMISGGIAGFASALYFLGYLIRLEYPVQYTTGGYGYLAILVTWLSLLEISMIPVSAYVVSCLYNAGYSIATYPEVREALVAAGFGGAELSFRLIMIGSILLSFSVLRFLSDYEVRLILHKKLFYKVGRGG